MAWHLRFRLLLVSKIGFKAVGSVETDEGRLTRILRTSESI